MYLLFIMFSKNHTFPRNCYRNCFLISVDRGSFPNSKVLKMISPLHSHQNRLTSFHMSTIRPTKPTRVLTLIGQQALFLDYLTPVLTRVPGKRCEEVAFLTSSWHELKKTNENGEKETTCWCSDISHILFPHTTTSVFAATATVVAHGKHCVSFPVIGFQIGRAHV